MSNEIFDIDPIDLQFHFELEKQIYCIQYLTNKTDNYVAYKVKTTNPKMYMVRPRIGVVLPRSSIEVLVTMQAQKEVPAHMQCNDKFLIQCFVASPDIKVTNEMFNKEAENPVEETKLKVIYVDHPPRPVREGSLPRASVSGNGNAYVSNKLFHIDPIDLQFHFELAKQIYSTHYLTNKTDNYVAYEVKLTNPKKYTVMPNIGVVLPGSSIEVVVTMQAQKEAPADMQCKDKFLLQCFVASPDIEVTTEMFNKEAGYPIEETKLKVVYVDPRRPPSEEGSLPIDSVSDNGNASDFTAERALTTRLSQEKNSAAQLNNRFQQDQLEEEQLRRGSNRNQSGGGNLIRTSWYISATGLRRRTAKGREVAMQS